MPKINVYLPDDLADAVRKAGISVSPICQQALRQEIERMGIQARILDEIDRVDLELFDERGRKIVFRGRIIAADYPYVADRNDASGRVMA